MAKEYKGLIGKIAKDLFHDGAKGKTVTKEVTWKTYGIKDANNAWDSAMRGEGLEGFSKALGDGKEHKREVTANLYKYTDKLAKYAGIGAVSGAVATGAASMISPDKDKPIDASILRGAIWGTMMGAGVNVLPKFIHNSYSRHGFRRLNVDMEEYVNDALRAYSPVIAEFDNPAEREIRRKAKAEKRKLTKAEKERIKKDRDENPLKNINNFFDEHKKLSTSNTDFHKRVQVAAADSVKGEDYFKKGSGLNKGQGSKVSFTFDDFLRMKRLQTKMNEANKAFEKIDESGAAYNTKQQLFDWTQETKSIYRDLSPLSKYGAGGAFLMQGGFNSTYHHLIEPTGQFFKNIKDGNFKAITLEQGAATAFSAYGLYEAGVLVDEIASGDYGAAAKTAAILAGSKLAYGAGVDAIKLEARRRAAGLTYSSMYQGFKFKKHSERFLDGAVDLSPNQSNEIAEAYQRAGRRVFDASAPEVAKGADKVLRSFLDAGGDVGEAVTLIDVHGPLGFLASGDEAVKAGYDTWKSIDFKSAWAADKERFGERESKEFVNTLKHLMNDQEHRHSVAEMYRDYTSANHESIAEWETYHKKTIDKLKKDFLTEEAELDFNVLAEAKRRGKAPTEFMSDLVYQSKWAQNRGKEIAPVNEGKVYDINSFKKKGG